MLFFAFKGVHLNEILSYLKQVKYIYIIPSLIFYILSFITRAIRWQIFLGHLKKVTFNQSFSTIMISWASNNVLPFRLGELVRPYVISKKTGIEMSASLATVGVERVIDGLSLIGIFSLLFWLNGAPSSVAFIGYFALPFFSLIFLFMLFYYLKGEVIENFISKLNLSFIPKIALDNFVKFLSSLRKGMQCLKFSKNQGKILFYSIIIWICEGMMYFFIIKGFRLPLSIVSSFFVMSIINLGTAVPTLPGLVVNFTFFSVLALSIYGISKDIALAFSGILWVSQIPTITLIGFYYLSKEDFSLKEMKHIKIV